MAKRQKARKDVEELLDDTTTPQKHPYQKQIDETFDIISRDQTECDKQLLALSSGFLAVSLAFIKDVVKLQQASALWALYFAWITLGFCVVLVLFSFQFSIAGNFKAKAYWENLNLNPTLEFPDGHAEAIKKLNRICAGMFALGVSFLLAFIIWNIHKEAGMPITMDGSYMKSPQQGDWVQKGSNIKAPPPPAKPAQANPSSGSTSTGQGQGSSGKK
jgi:hypothetical protein